MRDLEALVDRLALSDLRHLAWRAADGFLDLETLGCARVPGAIYRREPGRPDGGPWSGWLRAHVESLAEAEALGLEEIHVRRDAGLVAWGQGRIHVRPWSQHAPSPDVGRWLLAQDPLPGVFRLRALASAHARLDAAARTGPRGGLRVLDASAIAHRLLADAAALPEPEGLLVRQGPTVALIDVAWCGPMFVRV